MTRRNSSIPKSRRSGSSSITPTLIVCMCTFGVSLYSSTASHPLSRFTVAPSSCTDLTFGRRSNNLFSPDRRPVAVDLVEEQSHGGGHRAGAGTVDQIEAMSGAGQLHVAHRRMRDRAQPLDEAARLFDGDHRVLTAVNHQEWRRFRVHPRNRRSLPEHLGVTCDPLLDNYPLQEIHEADPLRCRAVFPVVAAVDSDDGVDRGVGAFGKLRP